MLDADCRSSTFDEDKTDDALALPLPVKAVLMLLDSMLSESLLEKAFKRVCFVFCLIRWEWVQKGE